MVKRKTCSVACWRWSLTHATLSSKWKTMQIRVSWWTVHVGHRRGPHSIIPSLKHAQAWKVLWSQCLVTVCLPDVPESRWHPEPPLNAKEVNERRGILVSNSCCQSFIKCFVLKQIKYNPVEVLFWWCTKRKSSCCVASFCLSTTKTCLFFLEKGLSVWRFLYFCLFFFDCH